MRVPFGSILTEVSPALGGWPVCRPGGRVESDGGFGTEDLPLRSPFRSASCVVDSGMPGCSVVGLLVSVADLPDSFLTACFELTERSLLPLFFSVFGSFVFGATCTEVTVGPFAG